MKKTTTYLKKKTETIFIDKFKSQKCRDFLSTLKRGLSVFPINILRWKNAQKEIAFSKTQEEKSENG